MKYANAFRLLLDRTSALGCAPGISQGRRRLGRAARVGAAAIPHAFGRAQSLAYYGSIRATRDIDTNVFLPASESARVFEVPASPSPLDFDYVRGWLERIDDDGRERLSRLERLIASGGVVTD